MEIESDTELDINVKMEEETYDKLNSNKTADSSMNKTCETPKRNIIPDLAAGYYETPSFQKNSFINKNYYEKNLKTDFSFRQNLNPLGTIQAKKNLNSQKYSLMNDKFYKKNFDLFDNDMDSDFSSDYNLLTNSEIFSRRRNDIRNGTPLRYDLLGSRNHFNFCFNFEKLDFNTTNQIIDGTQSEKNNEEVDSVVTFGKGKFENNNEENFDDDNY